jgi:hypothetical protein
MKRDYFLIAILAGLLVLVTAAVGLYFLRQGSQAYTSDARPEGVVHNYALALLDEDYPKAYSYLADKEYKPTFAEFYSEMVNHSNSFVLEVGEAQVTGQEATVDPSFLDTSYSPSYPSTDYAHLLHQNGEWKLDQMPYSLWGYSWYMPPEEYRY